MATIDLELNYKQVLSIVKQLKANDRKKLLSEISMSDLEIPLEVQKISLERAEKYKKNPEILLDWDEVSKTLIS